LLLQSKPRVLFPTINLLHTVFLREKLFSVKKQESFHPVNNECGAFIAWRRDYKPPLLA